jgi:hypothetical protein
METSMDEHRRRQAEAVGAEAEGQRLLMAGQDPTREFARAARLYRESWDLAPPGAYGRLVGAVKAGILAGEGEAVARWVREQATDPGESATAWYALALAALAVGDDPGAREAAGTMEATSVGAAAGAGAGGPDPFVRAARAIDALAVGDAGAYAAAVGDIVRDFEARTLHLTGVAVADTALVLERLAAARGLAANIRSPVLPAPPE